MSRNNHTQISLVFTSPWIGSASFNSDDRFSNPSTTATIVDQNNHPAIIFNTLLTLTFKTDTCELPSTQLQLILVMCEQEDTKKVSSRKQQIIGIASITIFYPLQDYLKGYKIFRFEKSLDSKATIKAQINLQVNKKQYQFKSHSPSSNRSFHKSPRSRDSSPQSSQSLTLKKKSLSGSERSIEHRPLSKSQIVDNSRYKEAIKALTQQRNQLYKMSQDLYKQLKKCSTQRDQYLRELKQKQMLQEEIKAQLQFLKLKVYEYEQSQSHHQNHEKQVNMQQQIWQLEALNEHLQSSLQQKDKTIKQLQRKVKQSLIALHDFKQQALTARSQLINKQSQLTFISKQTKNLDTAECIQQLVSYLQQRSYEQPLQFSCIYQQENQLTNMIALIKKDVAALFLKLFGRNKSQKDKEWLMNEKVQFEKGLQERILQFSKVDHQ